MATDRESNSYRLNPRTGETTAGWMCLLCARADRAGGYGGASYTVCPNCLDVDQRASQRQALPYVLPVVVYPDLEAQVPAAAYTGRPQSSHYEDVAGLQEQALLLNEWGSAMAHWTARRFGVEPGPDVPLKLWQSDKPQSPAYSARCFVEFLDAFAPSDIDQCNSMADEVCLTGAGLLEG